jgi:hypothetical protein
MRLILDSQQPRVILSKPAYASYMAAIKNGGHLIFPTQDHDFSMGIEKRMVPRHGACFICPHPASEAGSTLEGNTLDMSYWSGPCAGGLASMSAPFPQVRNANLHLVRVGTKLRHGGKGALMDASPPANGPLQYDIYFPQASRALPPGLPASEAGCGQRKQAPCLGTIRFSIPIEKSLSWAGKMRCSPFLIAAISLASKG